MTKIVAQRSSLSERTVSAARLVLGGQSGGLRAYLAFAGPAVIASVAYMDPGNFATNIQAGARYGYTLLWVVLAANLIVRGAFSQARHHFRPPDALADYLGSISAWPSDAKQATVDSQGN